MDGVEAPATSQRRFSSGRVVSPPWRDFRGSDRRRNRNCTGSRGRSGDRWCRPAPQPGTRASLDAMRLRHMNRPWVVVAFGGWNDAGSAATQAATLIAEYSEARTWRTIDGEAFHDFRQTRPAITVMNDLEIVNWPSTAIRIGRWQGRCLLYTSPSPRDKRQSRMPSSA